MHILILPIYWPGKKNYSAAAEHYQKVLAIQSHHVQAMNNLAFVYAGNGDYEKAISTLQQMSALQPDNPNIYYNLAGLKTKQGKIEGAVNWLAVSLEKGYSNCDHIKSDPDLKLLKNTEDYDNLMNRYCP